MPGPGYFAPGGATSLTDKAPNRGVYSRFPASSPKFNTNNDSQSTQARLFIQMQDEDALAAFNTPTKTKDGSPVSAHQVLLSDRAREISQALMTPDIPGRAKPKSKGIGGGNGYIDFLLQSVSLQQAEQYQVSEVLGDAYVAYFFGQRAPILQLSGVVLNTRQDNWYDAWHILYQELIRGTKLAQRRQSAVIRIDSRLYFGSFTNLNETFDAVHETKAGFTMGLLVEKIVFLNGRYNSQRVTNESAIGFSSSVAPGATDTQTDAIDITLAQEAKRANRKNEVHGSGRVVVKKVPLIDAEGNVVNSSELPFEETPQSSAEALQSRYRDGGLASTDASTVIEPSESVVNTLTSEPAVTPVTQPKVSVSPKRETLLASEDL